MLPGDEKEFSRQLRRRGRLTAAVAVSFGGTAMLVASAAMTANRAYMAGTALGFFASAVTFYRLHADGFTVPSVTLHWLGEEVARDRQLRAVFTLAVLGFLALITAVAMR